MPNANRAPATPLFPSFLLGGFECSTHRRRDGRRLDLIAATEHDRWAAQDYRRLAAHGIRTVRDGIRWHLIERTPGHYDWSSALPMIRAARAAGITVIWDLWHYGWPDDLDLFTPAFADRFARFAEAFARVLAAESAAVPFLAPVNEISFVAWAAGDVAYLNPFQNARGMELKVRLVRAAIAATDAVWAVSPRARIVHVDPIIHIVSDPDRPYEAESAENHRLGQFHSWDMLVGADRPDLGGAPKYLDIIGVNYYADNQWVLNGPRLTRADPRYRPLREMLAGVAGRYGRPLFIAETGAEGDDRAPWLRYVADEALAARAAGVPLHGICLYPVVDYPGWDDERHCPTGLFGYPTAGGDRPLYAPLAVALAESGLGRAESGLAELVTSSG